MRGKWEKGDEKVKNEEISYQTKKKLAESLKTHLKKKTFSKITVSEIITDCGVNRKTFYYHFENIYELLKWMFEKEAINVVKEIVAIEDYEQAIVFVMDYVEHNKEILNSIYDTIGRDELKRFFFLDFTEIVTIMITSVEKNMEREMEKEFKEFVCNFCTAALSELLVEEIQKKKSDDKKKTLEYILRIFRAMIPGLLNENDFMKMKE